MWDPWWVGLTQVLQTPAEIPSPMHTHGLKEMTDLALPFCVLGQN